MKNDIFKLSTILCLLFLFSCGEKTIYETTNIQTNQEWNILKPVDFSFDIQDTSKTYKVVLLLKIDKAKMQEKSIPVSIEISYPNNEKRNLTKLLIIQNAEVKDGVSQFPIQDHKQFSISGKYTYSFTHVTSKYNLAGVESVGLKVMTTSAKKEEKEEY